MTAQMLNSGLPYDLEFVRDKYNPVFPKKQTETKGALEATVTQVSKINSCKTA